MATLGLVEYPDAPAEVRAVYDDIMATRHTDWINNFWKALAHDPPTLRRTWESIKQIMAPGALDALTKEMLYLAVSATNQCGYCIASHTAAARKAGMTDAMFAELMAVAGMANETNRLASGYQVEIDERYKTKKKSPAADERRVRRDKPAWSGRCPLTASCYPQFLHYLRPDMSYLSIRDLSLKSKPRWVAPGWD